MRSSRGRSRHGPGCCRQRSNSGRFMPSSCRWKTFCPRMSHKRHVCCPADAEAHRERERERDRETEIHYVHSASLAYEDKNLCSCLSLLQQGNETMAYRPSDNSEGVSLSLQVPDRTANGSSGAHADAAAWLTGAGAQSQLTAASQGRRAKAPGKAAPLESQPDFQVCNRASFLCRMGCCCKVGRT